MIENLLHNTLFFELVHLGFLQQIRLPEGIGVGHHILVGPTPNIYRVHLNVEAEEQFEA